MTDDAWFLATRVRFKLSAADNAGRLSIIESDMPFGFSPPIHVHQNENETFCVLAGEVRFEVDGEAVVARAGDVVHAASGTVHSFIVTSPGGGRFLTITDGQFEAMVRELARPAEHADLPPFTPPTPAQAQALAAACLRNGIELLGPPLALSPVAQAA